jgi:hypothetical protein
VTDPTLFSDSQFATLVAALGVIGAGLIGTLKWAASRVVKALDDNSTASREMRDAFIAQKSKLDEVHDWMQDHTPVEEMPPQRQGRTRSNPMGTAIVNPGGGYYGPSRPGTKGG